MDLPFFKKNIPATTWKYLFALEISPQTVKSAVWSVVNDKPQVLAVGAAVNWDDKTTESLITATDQTLSDATNHLDPSGKVNIEEVILGLPSEWVQEDKIKHNFLVMLKDMGHKLDLKPVGFVVTVEAVVKYLHHSENVPPTAILLGFWPQTLEVTLVRLGKIDSTEVVKRSSHLAEDVVEGLSRFPSIDVLPSRMLLYDSGLDLEETKQLLLQHPWQAPQTRLSFLHFPKIEILPADFTVKAIALSGGSEVAKAIGLLTVDVAETEIETVVTGSGEDLGFVDMDIQSLPAEPTAEPKPTPVAAPVKPKLVLPKITLPNFRLPKMQLSLATAVGILVAVMVGLGAAYWYLPRADVVVFVKPQNFQTTFALVADTRQQTVDVEAKSVPAQALTVEMSGDKSVPTTGSVLVGDKATGEVTISNALDSSRQLAIGTVITSPSGLKFLLNEAVTVASASGSAGNLSPGKAKVKVTADNIGTDANLTAGTVFRVGSLAITQVDAKNEAAFSGGTSRQAQAVAKADIDKLKSELVGSLKDQAREKLLSQISDNQTVITESIASETISEDFDHKLGEEASEVKLTLAVKATGIVVAKADLQTIVDAQIKPQIPPGYTSVTEQNQAFKVKDTDENKVVFDASVTALLLPQFDTDQAITGIRGKTPLRAKEFLQSFPVVAQVDMAISPRLPLSLTTLPRVAKNISISVRPFK